MYKTKCANPKCNKGKDGQPKEGFVYAKDKMGNLPTYYCSTFCEKEAKYDKRFDSRR